VIIFVGFALNYIIPACRGDDGSSDWRALKSFTRFYEWDISRIAKLLLKKILCQRKCDFYLNFLELLSSIENGRMEQSGAVIGRFFHRGELFLVWTVGCSVHTVWRIHAFTG
jgi:hypothetical protein